MASSRLFDTSFDSDILIPNFTESGSKSKVVPSWLLIYNESLDVSQEISIDDVPANTRPFNLVFITITFVFMVVGLVGNSLLVIIYARDKSKRTTTNTYILNIATSDLVITLICSGIQICHELAGTWAFDDIICKSFHVCIQFAMFVLVLSLTAFSIERYYAIIYPLKRYVSRRKSDIVSTYVIWVISFIFSIPKYFHSGVRQHIRSESHTVSAIYCVIYNEQTDLSRYLSLIDFSLFYILPLCIISTMYTAVYKRLMNAASDISSLSSANITQIRQAQIRRKVARMVIVLAVVFFLGFLPHNFYILKVFFFEASNNHWSSDDALTYSFGFLHFWLNPVVLYFYNDFVQNHFNYYLTCGLKERSKIFTRTRSHVKPKKTNLIFYIRGRLF